MGIIGTPRSFHKRFRYIVEVDGVASSAWSKCSELSVEAAVVSHWEGGALTPHKSPGRLTFADITLERGVTKDRDLYDWFSDVANTSSGIGLNDHQYKRNLDVVQLDRDGSTQLRRWTIYGAWPVKLACGEWDNDADEVVIEKVTLAFDYFELRQG